MKVCDNLSPICASLHFILHIYIITYHLHTFTKLSVPATAELLFESPRQLYF